MHASPSNIRVIVRLPYNRPEEQVSDPPRVEWNSEKEKILWEVIAKSRAVEGGGTDWKGLAAHLQVPLPYLLYRAQARYEEDLRGLQGIRGTLSPTITSPIAQVVSPTAATSKQANVGEYFPRFPTAGERPGIPRRDSLRTEGLGNGDMKSSVLSPTTRPTMGVRARLSSLGSVQAVARSRKLSTISNNAAKRILSSSTATLQGPRRPREVIRPLSPTSSHPSPEDSTSPDASSEDSDDSNDEDGMVDEQETLRLKLENLQKLMTADAIGLVASPSRMVSSRTSGKEKGRDRPRDRPLSSSSSGNLQQFKMSMTRRLNRSPSHHSLSSIDATSPQHSIPDIPSPSSPPPEPTSRPGRRQTPLQTRPLNQPGKSTSPPAVSSSSARGHNAQRTSYMSNAAGRPHGGRGRSERSSEFSSEAESYEQVASDDSVMVAAYDSINGSGSRASSGRFSSYSKSRLYRGFPG